MAAVTAAMVKELREMTGAGMMDCKKALAATDGDMDKAVDFLREKGLATAQKKAGRIAAEGLVTTCVSEDGKNAVAVEVNAETDFVAKNEAFKKLAADIAMHIGAYAPKYVRRDEVPADVIAAEREIQLNLTLNEGKPAKIAEKIVDGRMEKFFQENCLEEQEWVLDPNMTVLDAVKELITKMGENIKIRRFVRFEKGEGLEKRTDNFAEEVMKQAGQV